MLAQRDAGEWRLTLADASGKENVARARALVNATGPWVKQVRDLAGARSGREGVAHVKGSHIVVPRVHDEPHAYILQNPDNRIIFVIPYEERFSLIGTTDIPVEAYEQPEISREEIDYLCLTVNAYLAKPVGRSDIVWTYSGVRPLYDDGSYNPSAITRDYVLKLDAEAGAPLLSIFGGKITTYRKLAEAALAQLLPYFPSMRRPWTHGAPLPGGDFVRRDLAAALRELEAAYPALPQSYLSALLRRHGTRACRVLGSAQTLSDLGARFGSTLYAKEVDYLVAEEWALSAEDVLWRRTKCGLQMTPAEWADVAAYLDRRHAMA